MTATKTRHPKTTSTPRLSEAARHLVIPEGIVTSTWPRVEARLATVGYRFDLWQQGLGSVALGCRADGLYAATVGGVGASIPRQVGKTYTVGGLVVGLCLEFSGSRWAWTSHHNRTNTNTFRALQSIVRRKAFRPHIEAIREANGEQEIRFKNGSVIFFGARAQGFGRGMEEMDGLVLDEAQILDLKALEDMVPATNQAKHPHGALIFFIGTPPRPTDPGEAFTAKRTAALSGATKDHVWVEFGADPDAALDDQDQWRKANPSFPHRTPLASMLRMRENIPDDDSWRREALGIWPELDGDEGWEVWPRESWEACASDVSASASNWLTGPVTLSLEVTPDRSRCALGVSGDTASGRVGIDLAASQPGVGWSVDALVAICRDRDVSRIVVDPKGPAGSFVEPLGEALSEAGLKVPVEEITFEEFKRTTGDAYDAVVAGEVEHRSRPELDLSVARATRRKTEVWLIERRTNVAAEINAVVLARWGHLQGAPAVQDFAVVFT